MYVAAGGVDIDTHLHIEQRNVVIARTEIPIVGAGGAVMYEPVTVGGEYVLYSATAMPAGTPGIVAGRHLDIRDTEGLTNGDAAVDSRTGRTVRISGFVNLLDVTPGWLDVNTDGSVTLTEVDGDLRVGLVRSRASDVDLTADDSILDGDPGDAATHPTDQRDVEGVNIDLTATNGAIGTEADFLETNLWDVIGVSEAITLGLLDADARYGVRIREVLGDMRVGLIESRQDDTTWRVRDGRGAGGGRFDPRRRQRRRRRRGRQPHRPAGRRWHRCLGQRPRDQHRLEQQPGCGRRSPLRRSGRHDRDHRDHQRAVGAGGALHDRPRPVDGARHQPGAGPTRRSRPDPT